MENKLLRDFLQSTEKITATKAILPENYPITALSAALYKCYKRLVINKGYTNMSNSLSTDPVVRSTVFFLGITFPPRLNIKFTVLSDEP